MSDDRNPRQDARPPVRRGPGGGPPFMRPVEKAKDFKGAIRKLLAYISEFKVHVIIVMLFAIGSTVFAIIGPKIMGNIVNDLFTGLVSKVTGVGGIDFEAIGRSLLFLLLLYVISAVFSWIQGIMMSGISQKVSYRLRKEISQKINRMPMKYFDSMTHGEILSRVTNDVDTLGMGLNQSVTQIVSSVTMALGVLVMMISISPLMTVIALLTMPMSIFFIGGIVRKSQKFFANQQKFLGNVNGTVEEVYGGHIVVKAFNGEEKVIEEFDASNEKLYESAWKSQFLSGLMFPLMNFIGNIGYVLSSLLGGYLVIKGTITIGNIQSFIQYVRMFNQPVGQIAQMSNQIQQTAASAERVFEFLGEQEEDIYVQSPVSTEGLKGDVAFQNVHFGYNADHIIINDFSTSVNDGQKVAIVGPTGAGKTTMVKLLMRFYDVNEGAILVDGHDIRHFNRPELRGMFGMVLQDTWLFSGSIMENIRYGRSDATDEEVIEAAKAAHAHRFIKTLPNGYDMELNEEANNVSGGQKQLLTIARAILAEPKILILDEATSSVDTRTEIRIQKAMDNLMRGKTSFIIAHRLSTIRDADTILVMRDGDIVEQGNHEELLAKGAFYAELYNSQFEAIGAAG